MKDVERINFLKKDNKHNTIRILFIGNIRFYNHLIRFIKQIFCFLSYIFQEMSNLVYISNIKYEVL